MRILRTERRTGIGLAGLLTLLLTPAICRSQEAPPTSSENSYGYVSTSQGEVTLLEADTGESVSVDGTEAVLAGDELRLSGAARAEVRLADRNVLWLDDQAELVFLTLAGSPDRSDLITALKLRGGSLQITVADDYIGDTPPAIETPNAYVELRGPGTYLVEALGDERTLVVARRGSAKVRAGTAITTVQAGEEALVEGLDGTSVRLAAARGLVPLERWGESRTASYTRTTEIYVDESIRHAAAPLRSHGSWTYVRGTRAWRPHVSAGWRPYSRGRWRHTPTGLYWVSYEPWGRVPHHYGNWDLVPGFGWVWFPGHRFASAWVFWYWGPKYVGWVPWGYYAQHYGTLSFGVYGWAGGVGVHFRDWCFTPYGRFGHRDQHRYIKSGRDMGREGERIGRGIITTDTRGLTPGHWTSPDRVNRILAYDEGGKKFELEEIGPFVNREKDVRLPGDRERQSADGANERTRASIDPVRTTRTVELTPGQRDPTTREKARQEVTRRPSIDPVRTTRTVELTPGPRDPTTREKARQEVTRRPSIDPVRTTRTVELTPGPRDPTTRDKARQEVTRRPSIDPVRTTRAVELTPAPRDPTTREKARQEVTRRPSIDPVRTTRTVEVAPKSQPVARDRARVETRSPTATPTRKAPAKPPSTRPSVGERTKTPARVTRPSSAAPSRPARTAPPKRVTPVRTKTPRSSPARTAPRSPSRAKPVKTKSN